MVLKEAAIPEMAEQWRRKPRMPIKTTPPEEMRQKIGDGQLFVRSCLRVDFHDKRRRSCSSSTTFGPTNSRDGPVQAVPSYSAEQKPKALNTWSVARINAKRVTPDVSNIRDAAKINRDRAVVHVPAR